MNIWKVYCLIIANIFQQNLAHDLIADSCNSTIRISSVKLNVV